MRRFRTSNGIDMMEGAKFNWQVLTHYHIDRTTTESFSVTVEHELYNNINIQYDPLDQRLWISRNSTPIALVCPSFAHAEVIVIMCAKAHKGLMPIYQKTEQEASA